VGGKRIKMFGVMWEYNHARPLGIEEYKYYTLNPLPLGGILLQYQKITIIKKLRKERR